MTSQESQQREKDMEEGRGLRVAFVHCCRTPRHGHHEDGGRMLVIGQHYDHDFNAGHYRGLSRRSDTYVVQGHPTAQTSSGDVFGDVVTWIQFSIWEICPTPTYVKSVRFTYT